MKSFFVCFYKGSTLSAGSSNRLSHINSKETSCYCCLSICKPSGLQETLILNLLSWQTSAEITLQMWHLETILQKPAFLCWSAWNWSPFWWASTELPRSSSPVSTASRVTSTSQSGLRKTHSIFTYRGLLLWKNKNRYKAQSSARTHVLETSVLEHVFHNTVTMQENPHPIPSDSLSAVTEQ